MAKQTDGVKLTSPGTRSECPNATEKRQRPDKRCGPFDCSWRPNSPDLPVFVLPVRDAARHSGG